MQDFSPESCQKQFMALRNKTQKPQSIPPSAEWMLNNFQLQPSVLDNSKTFLDKTIS